MTAATTAFVSLVVSYVDAKGGDVSLPITINGVTSATSRFTHPRSIPMTNETKPAPLQQGEYLPLSVRSAPERIWLDLGFDQKETDADFSDLNTPTWSADNASGHGIEYVRADLA